MDSSSSLVLLKNSPSTQMPDKASKSEPTQLISGDGEFYETSFNNLLNSLNLQSRKPVVVGIMGPQSSGKSTLLNHLFDTNFKEMDAEMGRSQTTNGIWLQKAPLMKPLTVVLDLEGTDGKQRGQDDTTFEKQSALFALAVSDILLINIRCHDIGLEHAANMPLLKTIFEVIMLLFNPRKTTLLFVIRDTTKTPFQILLSKLREDVDKVWETVRYPQGLEQRPLTEIFNVEITALSNYELNQDTFEKEVAQVRRNFFSTTSPKRCGESDDVLLTSEFSFREAKRIWDRIKDYKGHEFSPYKVMVATAGCEEIAKDKLMLFKSDKDWLALEQAAETRLALDFGEKISLILRRYLIEYDQESIHLEKDVRKAKREYLVSEALKVVNPAYMNTLGHLRSEALQSFKNELETLLSSEGARFAECIRTCEHSCELQFDQKCSAHAAISLANWDASTVRRELVRDLESHALLLRAQKLSQTIYGQRERITNNLIIKLINILHDNDDKDKWDSIRNYLKKEINTSKSALYSALEMFELEPKEVESMISDMRQHARDMVVTNFRNETRDPLLLMKKRFVISLRNMKCSVASAKDKVYSECLEMLSTLAVIRLDENYDNVGKLLRSSLTGAGRRIAISPDDHPLASNIWEKVPAEITLITPVQCRDIWDRLKEDMEIELAKAKYIEEQYEKENKHKSLPTWAIVGLSVLGISAFVILLRLTNLDVALALASAVATGVVMIVDGRSKYTDTGEYIDDKDVGDADRFRKRNPKVMTNLEKCMTGLLNVIKVASVQSSIVKTQYSN